MHHAAPTRDACVVHEIMDGHRPAVWLSDRYSAQQGHADRQQTCLAYLARDVAYALDAGDGTLALRMKLWLDGAFSLARTISSGTNNICNPASNSGRSAIDGLFAEACTNAKAAPANISVYTIAFSIPGDPIDSAGQSLLQNCASSPGQYFLANDSNGLIAAFAKIANSIGAPRISQ